MAVKQIDAVSSFQHIVDNVPAWKDIIIELSTYATQRHEEFVAEYARLLHEIRPKKKKSESVSSLRSIGPEATDLLSSPSLPLSPLKTSELAEISPFEAGNRFLYAQAHKKRKPGTSIRSGASGPQKFRNKQMAVIYYDHHIQAELDKLVKAFGVARNNLRKGKNSYTAGKGFQLPSLSRRYGVESLLPTSMSRPGICTAKAQSDSVTTTPDSNVGDGVFVRTDKDIDVIQSICETAAHQAIRDGDCSIELNSTLEKLDVLLDTAQTTLDALKAELKKEEDEEAAAMESTSVSETANTSSEATLCEKPSIEAFTIPPKTLHPVMESLANTDRPAIKTTTSAPAAPILSDTIEVDDDDDDDESIDLEFTMANLRTMNRARMRA